MSNNISKIENLLSSLDGLVNPSISLRTNVSTYKAGMGSSLIWSAGMQCFQAYRHQNEVYNQFAALISLKKELDEKLPVAAAADQRVEFAEQLLAWALQYNVSSDLMPTADDLLSLALSENPPSDLVSDEGDDEAALKETAEALGESLEYVRELHSSMAKKDQERGRRSTEAAQKFAAGDYDGLRRRLQNALDKSYASERFEVNFQQAALLTQKIAAKLGKYIDSAEEAAVRARMVRRKKREMPIHAGNARLLNKMYDEAEELLSYFTARIDSETSSVFEPADPDRTEMSPGRDMDVRHSGNELLDDPVEVAA